MIQIIGFLVKNRKAVLAAILAASIAGSVAGRAGYLFGHRAGEKDAVNASTVAALPIMEKQDEIRNLRPDDRALLERLRAGRF